MTASDTFNSQQPSHRYSLSTKSDVSRAEVQGYTAMCADIVGIALNQYLAGINSPASVDSELLKIIMGHEKTQSTEQKRIKIWNP